MPPLGFPLGSILGEFRPSNIRQKFLGNDQWLVSWTPAAKPDPAAFIIALNGKHYTTVYNQTAAIVLIPNATNPVLEVLQQPASIDANFFPSGLLAISSSNALKLTWNPPASVTDLEKYRIYWDIGTGTVVFDDAHIFAEIPEDGSSSYELITTEQASGTYKFVIRSVDFAGNESTNTTESIVVLTKLIDPVTGFTVSFSPTTDKATLNWTDPAGVTSVDLFDNAGSSINPFPNYASAIGTVSAGIQTFLTAALNASSLYVFGIRAKDAGGSDLNTSITERILLDASTDEISGFPPKPILLAQPSADGKIKLRAYIDPQDGPNEPTQVRFFTNDGAGGAIDFSTVIATGDLTQISSPWLTEITTGVFGETARKFAARSLTAAGVESEDSNTETITPDATSPSQPLSVVAAAGVT